MLAKFDDFLNSVTMYRLVLYCLSWLVGVAILLSFVGVLPYSPWALIGSVSALSAVGIIVTVLLERAYRLPHNIESPIITTLILFFILGVPSSVNEYLGLAIGILAALVSKYVINWRGAHVFNPAAVGALVASLTGLVSAAWWVATPVMLPFVVIVGLLILRKTRQFSLFFAFALSALVLLILQGTTPVIAIGSYPIAYLGFMMLTEPATMPSGFRLRLVYGVIVGLMFASQFSLGIISNSLQLALLVGNLFAFLVTARSGQLLKLVQRRQLSPTTYEFAFAPAAKINYKPGQYFAWTLGKVKFDSRGNRRSFTIASSPQEKELKLGIKFYEPGSQFKKTLLALKKGDGIHISALSGDFVLPVDPNKKLTFIAGGIGVTPFRSMIKTIILNKQKRDITLLYFANDQSEILYKDVWQEAKPYGVRVAGFTNKERLDIGLLQKYAPDFKTRNFYLSGPLPMVRGYKKVLKTLGIPSRNIHTDYFSGY